MSDNFPQEILLEILHRLPPNSLVKCTTVCKSWHSLITHPSFIYLHLRRSHSFLLLQVGIERPYPNIFNLRRDDLLLTDSSSVLRLPFTLEREFSVVGICNGLVCITSSEEFIALIICNPCIRRYVSLPKARDYPCLYIAGVGFGFDSRTLDYKVVRIVCFEDDKRYGLSPPVVEVYSLATGFWRTLDPAVIPACCLCWVGAAALHALNGFVDGIVHWAAKRRVGDGWYYFVLCFHFEDEVFGEVVLPESLARVSFNNVTVTVVGGGSGKPLTVYHVSRGLPCSCEIWVMKEYGVVESWNKLFAFNLVGFCLEAPALGITLTGITGPPSALCVRNNGEVLLLMEEEGRGCLYSLDVERRRLTNLHIGGAEFTWYLYSGYYAESLVLLDKTSGFVSY